jgi:hypothetical protein
MIAISCVLPVHTNFSDAVIDNIEQRLALAQKISVYEQSFQSCTRTRDRREPDQKRRNQPYTANKRVGSVRSPENRLTSLLSICQLLLVTIDLRSGTWTVYPAISQFG